MIGSEIHGVVTDRDFALALCEKGFTPDEPVQRVMTALVERIDARSGALDAARRMMELGVRRLPVAGADCRPVGMVTMDDLLFTVGQTLGPLAEGVRPVVAVA